MATETDIVDSFNESRVRTGKDPIDALLAAGMMAAANVQSEGVKKAAAEEGAAQPSPVYTINPEKGTFSVKDRPITDLMEKGGRDAAKPIDDVKSIIQQRYERGKAAGLLTDKDNPYAPEIEDGLTGYREMYRGSREIGNDPITSALYGLLGKTRMTNPQEQAADLRRDRINRVNDVVAPLEQEAQKQRNMATAERRGGFAALNTILDNGAGQYDSPESAIEAAKGQVTGAGFAWDDAYAEPVRQRFLSDRAAITKARTSEFNAKVTGMKDEDIRGYGGNFEAWLADNDPDGSMPAFQRGRAQKRFEGILSETKEKEKKEAAAEAKRELEASKAAAREARAAAAAERAADAAERANRGEARTVATDERKQKASAIEDVVKRIEENNKLIEANQRAFAKSENEQEDRVLQEQNRGKVEENKALRAQLDTMLGKKPAAAKPAAAAPKAPAQQAYAPRVEAGITAYMQARGIDRAAAIAELKKNGKLQ
jgi:chemotaxis protein histidine kinase CheA